MSARKRYALATTRHMSPGRALKLPRPKDIIPENAMIRLRRDSEYLDAHLNGASEKGHCVFRHKLFESDKVSALQTCHSGYIEVSTVRPSKRKSA